MTLPSDTYISLAPDLRICRILNGMWQVSGAHGPINREAALQAMARHQAAGFATWDLADHYGPAEDFIGAFPGRAADDFVAFTKWVPRPGTMTPEVVQHAIGMSRRRMGAEALDALQFHWWGYGDRRYLDALHHLDELRSRGVRHVGLTNFDTEHLAEILDEGIPILSNQVQYSLVDRRPEVGMTKVCIARGVGLLTYGTLCGGLQPQQREPDRARLNTTSLQKYKRMIDAWGGWRLFQELLGTLKSIADKHETSMASVATRSILDRPGVSGVIVGVHLGVTDHVEANERMFQLQLDDEDHADLDRVFGEKS